MATAAIKNGSVKKRKRNKSRYIREALERLGEHASSREIVESVAKNNRAKVSPTLVAQVRKKRPRDDDSETMTAGVLMRAKRVADEFGGAGKARDALSFLERLQRRPR